MSVFVNVGIIYPFVGKSAFTCGMGGVSMDVEFATCPLAVPTLIFFPVVSIFNTVHLVLCKCVSHLNPLFLFVPVVSACLFCWIYTRYW